MIHIHYLAYGSNLHPLRLIERVPSARLIGVAPLPGYRVRFHKRSIDSSAKCDLVESDRAATAYGALYELLARDKPALDRAEGLGNGYKQTTLKLSINGIAYFPYTYVASTSHIDPTLKPYHWYKRLVIEGAIHHQFPSDYIADIEGTPSIADPDVKRSANFDQLLVQLAGYATSAIPYRLPDQMDTEE